jgi:Protein of unknown function (DUF2917)
MLSVLNPVVPLHNEQAWLPKTLANSATTRVILNPENYDTHCLQRGAALVLPQPMGCEIECLEGCVWIAHVGDSKDLVLGSGQFYEVGCSNQILAYAMETTQLHFRKTSTQH